MAPFYREETRGSCELVVGTQLWETESTFPSSSSLQRTNAAHITPSNWALKAWEPICRAKLLDGVSASLKQPLYLLVNLEDVSITYTLLYSLQCTALGEELHAILQTLNLIPCSHPVNRYFGVLHGLVLGQSKRSRMIHERITLGDLCSPAADQDRSTLTAGKFSKRSLKRVSSD